MTDENLGTLIGYARSLSFFAFISFIVPMFAPSTWQAARIVAIAFAVLSLFLYEWAVKSTRAELAASRRRVEAFEASQKLEPSRRAELRQQWLGALDNEFSAGSRHMFKALKEIVSPELMRRMSDELSAQRPTSESLLRRLLEERKHERYDELVDAMVRPPLSEQRAER